MSMGTSLTRVTHWNFTSSNGRHSISWNQSSLVSWSGALQRGWVWSSLGISKSQTRHVSSSTTNSWSERLWFMAHLERWNHCDWAKVPRQSPISSRPCRLQKPVLKWNYCPTLTAPPLSKNGRKEGRKGKNHRVPYPLRRNFDFGASQKPSAPTKKAQFRLHADYVSEAYLGSEMLIY